MRLVCVSETQRDRKLWSQPWIADKNSQGLLAITHCEKRCGWSKGHMEAGQHFSGTDIFILAPGVKHSTAQEWGWEVGMDCKGWTRHQRPWNLQLLSRKVWKNGLCGRTNLHWNWEPCLQGGKNLFITRYPIKLSVLALCMHPRTLGIPAGSTLEPELVLFPSVSCLFLPLSPSLIHLSFSSCCHQPITQNSLPCVYRDRDCLCQSGTNIPISMSSVWFIGKIL